VLNGRQNRHAKLVFYGNLVLHGRVKIMHDEGETYGHSRIEK
jgi:hypothetical protein